MPSTKDTGIPAVYVRGGMPVANPESLRLFVNDEFRKIEIAFKNVDTTATSSGAAWDFEGGASSTTYTVGAVDLDEGASA